MARGALPRRLTVPELRSTLLAATGAMLTVGIAACGSASHSTKRHPASASRSTREVSARTPNPVRHSHRSRNVQAVRVAPTAYGPALTDRRGFALYLFTHDVGLASTCYDE